MAGLSYGSLLRDTEVDESENKSLVSVMRISGSQPRVPSLYVFLFSSAFWKTLGWHKSNFNKCTTVLFWQLQEEAPGTLTCQCHVVRMDGSQRPTILNNESKSWFQFRLNLMVVMFIISTDLFLKMTVFGRLPLNDICLLFFFFVLALTLMSI